MLQAPDPDRPLREALARHRAFATLLLVIMAGLTLLSYALPAGWPADLLGAAAKAGLVGGIADWFAVTALFRHPLGLPIPHTAIIPAQKERLGRALGNFVANHVFTQADVARTLAGLDVAAIIQRFLNDPLATRPAAEALARLLPRALRSIEDGRAARLFARLLPRLPRRFGGLWKAAGIKKCLVFCWSKSGRCWPPRKPSFVGPWKNA